jgi:hypothetical protein
MWNVWVPLIKFAMQFHLAMFVWHIFKIRQFLKCSTNPICDEQVPWGGDFDDVTCEGIELLNCPLSH